MTPRSGSGTRRRLPVVAVLVAFGISTVAGCASDSASDSGGGVSSGVAEKSLPGSARGADAGGAALVEDEVAAEAPDSDGQAAPGAVERAIIATGTVNLRVKDVEAGRRDTQKVVDKYRGLVTEEETDSDGKGAVRYHRLVVRIPSDAFGKAVDELKAISTFRSVTIGTQDVTSQVVDVGARVRSQTASLERLEALFARAETLRDVVALEGQISRRQADLDSLKAQQDYLEDQTSLSTITVYLEKRDTSPASKDDNPFVAGLTSGWRAIGSVFGAVLTLVGALLPFALVGLLIGYPAWRLLRRAGRARSGAGSRLFAKVRSGWFGRDRGATGPETADQPE
ncbi:MAG: DUF4349 domain-containing protein [Nocardioides sp.]